MSTSSDNSAVSPEILELSIEIFRKDAKLNFRHKKVRKYYETTYFFKINIFLQRVDFTPPRPSRG